MNFINGIKNYLLKGLTLKGIVKNMVGKNPVFGNLIDMADKGDTQGVENFAKNICKEMNIDFEKEYAEFKTNFDIN